MFHDLVVKAKLTISIDRVNTLLLNLHTTLSKQVLPCKQNTKDKFKVRNLWESLNDLIQPVTLFCCHKLSLCLQNLEFCLQNLAICCHKQSLCLQNLAFCCHNLSLCIYSLQPITQLPQPVTFLPYSALNNL